MHLFISPISVVSAIAAFIVMPFLSFYLKMHDAAVGILASCSKIVSLLITSVAWNGEVTHITTHYWYKNVGWVLFAGSVSGFISAFSSIVIRSMLSKCVTKAELGKIFSLLASLEAAVPLFAAPLFTYVYTHTLETWTGKRMMENIDTKTEFNSFRCCFYCPSWNIPSGRLRLSVCLPHTTQKWKSGIYRAS